MLPFNTCALYSQLLVQLRLKVGIFVGPRIQKVLKDKVFKERLTLNELRSWEVFKSVFHGFLGNTRVPDYQESIEQLQAYEDMGWRMSLKINFLYFRNNV